VRGPVPVQRGAAINQTAGAGRCWCSRLSRSHVGCARSRRREKGRFACAASSESFWLRRRLRPARLTTLRS
jgi:hypothetical protein